MVARMESMSLLPNPADSMWNLGGSNDFAVPDEQQPMATDGELPLTFSSLLEEVEKKHASGDSTAMLTAVTGTPQQSSGVTTPNSTLFAESDFPNIDAMVSEGMARSGAEDMTSADEGDHKRKRDEDQTQPQPVRKTASGKRKRNRPTVQQQKEARDKRLKELEVRNVFLRNLVDTATLEIEELKKGVVAILRKEGVTL